MRPLLKGSIETPLSDEAPRADGIEDNVDAHGASVPKYRIEGNMSENTAPVALPSFREAFRFWLKLGFISFGGPAGQIAVMQHELVDERRWIGQGAFLRALNFCMLLPGPEAQQLATYIGWRLHGIKGALTAGILFVLPGALILYALAFTAAAYGNVLQVAAVFSGLKPVVVAIVAHAVWRIGKRTLHGWIGLAVAAVSFLAIYVFHIPFPAIIVAAGLLGFCVGRKYPTAFSSGHAPETASSELSGPKPSWSRLMRMAALYVVLLVVPIAIIIGIAGPEPFLTIARFFTQAAFVTFGGAYAVLPYVADAAVNHFHWISADEMINGLALAETTPGPLILVLEYVGFFAGWNSGVLTPLCAATLGALISTYATFLPSIFLILIGAPYIERITRFPGAASALGAITTAVVGVILSLTVFLAKNVTVVDGKLDWIAIAAILVTMGLLLRFSPRLHWLVAGGAIFGLVRAALA